MGRSSARQIATTFGRSIRRYSPSVAYGGASTKIGSLLLTTLVFGCSAPRQAAVCDDRYRDGAVLDHSSGPCGGRGQRISVPSPSFEPHDSLASHDTLTGAWLCGGEVEFDYRSGITITEADGSQIRHPARNWRRMATDSLNDTATNINGIPAYVASPGPCVLGVVSLVRAGYLINVVGNSKISTSELKRVAASLAPGGNTPE